MPIRITSALNETLEDVIKSEAFTLLKLLVGICPSRNSV